MSSSITIAILTEFVRGVGGNKEMEEENQLKENGWQFDWNGKIDAKLGQKRTKDVR